MCFVLVLFQVHPSYPLVVAANRDEDRARPSRSPFRWPGEPAIWAGRDEVAGGTWLGVSEHGVLAALTNRRDGTVDKALPSRGTLCLEVLHEAMPAAAAVRIDGLLTVPQNPFNLLAASPKEAWVRSWRGDVWQFTPGAHVLTNRGDPDDTQQPSVHRALAATTLLDVESLALDALLDALGKICADTTEPDPICKPGGPRGTVSSSLIALHPNGTIAAYRHADGPPSERPYESVSL